MPRSEATTLRVKPATVRQLVEQRLRVERARKTLYRALEVADTPKDVHIFKALRHLRAYLDAER